jgi:hypothetical protein
VDVAGGSGGIATGLALDDRFLVYSVPPDDFCVPIAAPDEIVWSIRPNDAPADVALHDVFTVTSDRHVLVFGV